jgi:hypothetical protein
MAATNSTSPISRYFIFITILLGLRCSTPCVELAGAIFVLF